MDETAPSRSEPGPTGWRGWLYVNLHTGAWPGPGLSPLNKAIVVIILVAVVMAIVQSEPSVLRGNEDLRGIINSAHDRDGGGVWRCKEKTHEVR